MYSAPYYSFLFVEVSGYDCFPDRCYGKSELLFLDSTSYGNLQLLVFLGNWNSKEEALACRKSAMTLFWNLKQSDANLVRKKRNRRRKVKRKTKASAHILHSFTSSMHSLSHCNGNVKKSNRVVTIFHQQCWC